MNDRVTNGFDGYEGLTKEEKKKNVEGTN